MLLYNSCTTIGLQVTALQSHCLPQPVGAKPRHTVHFSCSCLGSKYFVVLQLNGKACCTLVHGLFAAQEGSMLLCFVTCCQALHLSISGY